MKKVYLLGAMTGLLLAGCANDEVVKPVTPVDKAQAPMSFNVGVRNMSRDSKPFEKVMDNFGVFAAKVNGTDTDAAFAALSWGTAGSLGEQVIMNNYKVEYDDTNKAWVYDGVTGDATQYLKYWDGSYAKTYFVAYAPWGAAGTLALLDNTVPSLSFPTVKISTDAADNYMYSNVQIEDNAAHVTTETKVPLRFNSVLSQVKLAIYEAIPGYKVEMAELVFDGSTDTHGIVAIPADVDGTDWSRGGYVSEGAATIVYSDANYATKDVAYTKADMDDKDLEFEIPTGEIGESYDDPTEIETTYYVLPHSATVDLTPAAGKTVKANSGLQFVMNYTLKSEDTNEVINVKGARVYVDPTWTAWKPNTVYTYVFRITTASSGTTTPDDPKDDPEEPGKALYPIVFDNIVVAEMENGVVTNEWDVNPEDGTTNPHNPNTHD